MGLLLDLKKRLRDLEADIDKVLGQDRFGQTGGSLESYSVQDIGEFHNVSVGSLAEELRIANSKVVQILLPNPINDKFHAVSLFRGDSHDWVQDPQLQYIWVFDLAGASTLPTNSLHNGVYAEMETGGSYYIRVAYSAESGQDLTDTKFWIPVDGSIDITNPPPWVVGTYGFGWYVTKDGSTYLEINPLGTSGIPGLSDDWLIIVPSFRGAFTTSLPYSIGDIVQELRHLYIINSMSGPGGDKGGGAYTGTYRGISKGIIPGRTSSFSSVATLTANITSASTTISLNSLVSLPSGFLLTLLIDNEEIKVMVLAGIVNILARNVNGTTKVDHTAGATVYRVRITYGLGSVHLVQAALQSDSQWDEADTDLDLTVLNDCGPIANGTFVDIAYEPFSGQWFVEPLCTVPIPGAGSGSGSGSGGGCTYNCSDFGEILCVSFPGLLAFSGSFSCNYMCETLLTSPITLTRTSPFSCTWSFFTVSTGGCVGTLTVAFTISGGFLTLQVMNSDIPFVQWSLPVGLWNCLLPVTLSNLIIFPGGDLFCDNWPATVTITEGPCGSGSGSGSGGGGNLVGWWKMNEGTGTTAFDYSGNNYHMSHASMAWSADTPGSQAGPGGSITASNTVYVPQFLGAISNIPSGASPRTFSIWYKLHTASADFQMSAPTGAAGGTPARWERFEAGSKTIFTDGTQTVDSTNFDVGDTWHLYTFVTDGSNWWYYQDGAIENSGTFSSSLTSSGPNLGVQLDAAAGGATYLKDARMYDFALSAADVASLFAGTFGP